MNAAQDYNVATTVGYANCPSGSCSGRLVHEVSSLVFDSSDTDASRRYKLFAHSYIVLTGDVLAYDLGYIDLYTAAAPAGPWTSEGKVVGWDSASKLSSDNAATNVSSWAQMHDCVALTEPGAIVRPGGLIQMAVGCVYFSGATPAIRIELLQSVDAGKTFDYVSRLTTADDAACLGYSIPQLNAADLFVAGGKSYIALSPAGPTSGGFDGYRGCLRLPAQRARQQDQPRCRRRADRLAPDRRAGQPLPRCLLLRRGRVRHGLCRLRLAPRERPARVPHLRFRRESPVTRRTTRSGASTPRQAASAVGRAGAPVVDWIRGATDLRSAA